MDLRPVRTHGGSRRVVGFAADLSPSSVLRDSPPGSSDSNRQRPEELASPLSALKRELSTPQLQHAPAALPKLRVGLGRKAMPRSKSHGNLLGTQTQPVPLGNRSAQNSPHAAGSGGSDPVRIPFEFSRRRTFSVDYSQQAGTSPGEECQDEMASTPVISAASSLIGHHLADRAPSGVFNTAGHGLNSSSVAGSPLSGGGAAIPRSQSVAKDLFVAQADAVMAHAQVQSLQAALRKEQEEVVRLREALQRMTSERDRLLMELAQGGDSAPLFLMDSPQLMPGGGAAHSHGPPAGQQQQQYQPQLPPVGAGLRALRLR